MKIIGITLIIAGILLGIYVGVWICLIGGIIQVVEACKATPIDSFNIAIGVLRFLSCSIAGYIVFLCCALLGGILFITGK